MSESRSTVELREDHTPSTLFRKVFQACQAEWSASRGIVVLLVVLIVAALRSTLLSISKPFWFDEVCTVLVSHLPNASAVWNALMHGADGQPPLYYMVERLSCAIVSDEHLAFRLPSILGFTTAAAFIYFILAWRISRLTALMGTCFFLCTSAADYASEARPYALLLACVSAAIFSWQRIEDSKLYAVLMAASLAGAASVHYYAVLVWSAFVSAEAASIVSRRRIRWQVWLALVLGAVPAIINAPILLEYRKDFGQHFWSKPDISQIIYAHDGLFRLSGHWGLALACSLSAIVLLMFAVESQGNGASSNGRGKKLPPLEELTLALVLLWLPLIAVVAAKVAHGAITERYTLPAILGATMVLGFIVERLPVSARTAMLIILFLQYGSTAISPVKSAMNGTLLGQRQSATTEIENTDRRIGSTDLPVVVGFGLFYLPRFYYAPTEVKARLYTIADSDAAIEYSATKTDSVDHQLLVLKRYFPLSVEGYGDFLRSHHHFILAADFGVNQVAGWLLTRLIRDGYSLRLLSSDYSIMFFEVSAPPAITAVKKRGPR